MLSLSMRLDPHTAYYFEPVFKEDAFSSKRMECFNQKDMEQMNMRTPDDEPQLAETERRRRAGLSDAEKKRAKNDEPLTQITILDGVTAYRLGGWESAESTVDKPVYEKVEYANKGVRSRILTHGWVYCRWGRARRFKEGKPADVPEAHGPAWDGGFKEFTDVEGVVDWLELEREEKARARGESMGGSGSVKGKERADVPVRSSSRVRATPGPSASARVGEEDLQAELLEETGSEEYESDELIA